MLEREVLVQNIVKHSPGVATFEDWERYSTYITNLIYRYEIQLISRIEVNQHTGSINVR